MCFSKLEAYYYLSSLGDKDAYNTLYENFVNKARTEVAQAGFFVSKHPEISAHFVDFVDELFFDTINDYQKEKCSFNHFCDYILKTRLVKQIGKLYCEWTKSNSAIDYETAELAVADTEFTDPNVKTLREDVEINYFRYRLASRTKNLTMKERRRQKIILLIYAGFKANEIREKLNLTKSQLRTEIEKIKKDEDILNLKLELK